VLRNLTDCSVYLLDFSGEVEVSNVVNSQIFVGKLTEFSLGLVRTFFIELGRLKQSMSKIAWQHM